ncbi:CBS domain-containing protein [Streptomyces sp. NPDC053367]|uniref:CBS domain-containing protein n=1 Tax=Streptomyces sp. NPDC053367 TaxID=3365700 RepID=UPI0037D6D110
MRTRIIGEVMTTDVVRVRPRTPFKELVRLLDQHRIGGLPVVDGDDKVVGVVSATDLVRGRAPRADRWPGRTPTHKIPGVVAAELMSTPAITVHPEQSVPDAARLMERQSIARLPVVDEEDRLVGIATRRDLLRVFLRTDEDIRRQVADDVLAGSLGLARDAVTVFVRDGVVTLKGCLEHRSDIPLAIRSAWRVEGAVGVVNALTYRLDDCPAPRAAHAEP